MGLDGLRGVAIAGVVAVHAGVPHVPGAGVGVDLFFALSGYLITSLLLRERETTGGVAFGRFYLRRAARLLPALVVMLVVTVAGSALIGSPYAAANRRALVSVLLYGSNWRRAFDGTATLGWYEHTWSLSVEEQFYLAWPLLVVLASRRGPRAVAGVALAGSAWASLERLLFHLAGASDNRLLWATDTNADQLLIGSALAALAVGHREQLASAARRFRWPAVGCLAAVTLWWPAPSSRWYWPVIVGGFPLIAAACAAIVADVDLNRGEVLERVARLAPAVALGEISYALYLWHVPALWAASEYGVTGPAKVVPAMFAVAVAAASTYWLEHPLRRAVRRRGRVSEGSGAVPGGVSARR